MPCLNNATARSLMNGRGGLLIGVSLVPDTFILPSRTCFNAGCLGAHHKRVADHVGRRDSRKPAVGLLVFGHALIRIGDCRAVLALRPHRRAPSTRQLGQSPPILPPRLPSECRAYITAATGRSPVWFRIVSVIRGRCRTAPQNTSRALARLLQA